MDPLEIPPPLIGNNLKSKRLIYILVAVGALVLALIMRFGNGNTDTALGLVTSATAMVSAMTANAPVHTGPAPPVFSTHPPLTTPINQSISSITPTPNHPIITVPPPEIKTSEPSIVVPTIKLAPRDAPFDVEIIS